jgi:hypothetical protein
VEKGNVGMRNIIIILSFLFTIAGGVMSCATEEPLQMKYVTVDFIKVRNSNRWIDGKYVTVFIFLYKGDDNMLYELPVDLGDHSRILVRR